MHVAPIPTENAHVERKQVRQKGAEKGRRPPRIVAESAGSEQVWTSIISGDSFEIREIAQSGTLGPTAPLTLYLEWHPSETTRFTLRGRLPLPPASTKRDGDKGGPRLAKVDYDLQKPDILGDVDYTELWTALVESATDVSEDELREWQAETDSLLLPARFDELSTAERRRHQKTLKIPDLDFEVLGSFDASTLEDCQLVPRKPDDAYDWAVWLQWGALSRYTLPADITEISARILAQFPYHELELPDSSALLERALDNPDDRRARFLLAPYDLGLWSKR